MLILKRRIGESIQIGDEITIKVLNINGKQARLGIEAPTSIEVHREEIFMRLQAENKLCEMTKGHP